MGLDRVRMGLEIAGLFVLGRAPVLTNSVVLSTAGMQLNMNLSTFKFSKFGSLGL